MKTTKYWKKQIKTPWNPVFGLTVREARRWDKLMDKLLSMPTVTWECSDIADTLKPLNAKVKTAVDAHSKKAWADMAETARKDWSADLSMHYGLIKGVWGYPNNNLRATTMVATILWEHDATGLIAAQKDPCDGLDGGELYWKLAKKVMANFDPCRWIDKDLLGKSGIKPRIEKILLKILSGIFPY